MSEVPIKLEYTWEAIQTNLKHHFMNRGEQVPQIIAISRGGLFVAGMISEITGIKNIDTLCIESYKDQKQGALRVLKSQASTESVLIVDDVCDSGETLKEAKRLYPNGKVFVLHYKPKSSSFKPDDYLWETDKWVVYPWEKI